MVSISLVMSVIVTNIYLRKDTPARVPRCLRRLFLHGDVAKPTSRSVPPPPPPPPPTLNGKLRQTADSRDGDVWTLGGRDVELASHRRRAGDSIHLSDVDDADLEVLHRRLRRDLAVHPDSLGGRDVELASHRRRAGDSIHLSDVDDADLEVLHRRLRRDLAVHPDSPHGHAHRFDRAACVSRCSAVSSETTEWQELARIIDRLFFWMFMVSSVALLTGLYASIHQRDTPTDDDEDP